MPTRGRSGATPKQSKGAPGDLGPLLEVQAEGDWAARALSLLPGVVLAALLAPLVAYRRRDALTLFFPPRGIRVAWIIGVRLGQLPHRDWPTRADGIPLQDRHAARIAAAVNNYRLWRQRRAERAATPANGLTPTSRAAALLPPTAQTESDALRSERPGS